MVKSIKNMHAISGIQMADIFKVSWVRMVPVFTAGAQEYGYRLGRQYTRTSTGYS